MSSLISDAKSASPKPVWPPDACRQDFLLIDDNGHGRVLCHHTVPGTPQAVPESSSLAVTAEPWARPYGERGITLTASAATLDYRHGAEVFARVGDGLRVGP